MNARDPKNKSRRIKRLEGSDLAKKMGVPDRLGDRAVAETVQVLLNLLMAEGRLRIQGLGTFRLVERKRRGGSKEKPAVRVAMAFTPLPEVAERVNSPGAQVYRKAASATNAASQTSDAV